MSSFYGSPGYVGPLSFTSCSGIGTANADLLRLLTGPIVVLVLATINGTGGPKRVVNKLFRDRWKGLRALQ